jgi:hypothetical protein
LSAFIDDHMGPVYEEAFREHHSLTRVPVLAGESKWASTVNAARIKAGLIRKAASLTPDANDLRYAVCARDDVEHADQDTLTVTAKDIFGS